MKRIPESQELIEGEEARKYLNRRDNRSLTTRLVALDILEKIPQVRTGRVLEIACGSGSLTNELVKLTGNQEIIGSDGSKDMVKYALKKYGHKYVQLDVNRISEFVVNKFDVIICKDSFHHFSSPNKVLFELTESLNPNGSLYIFDLCRDAPEYQIKRRIESMQDNHEIKRFRSSLAASHSISEMTDLILDLPVANATIFYPFEFSSDALAKSADLLDKDKTIEYRLNRLFAVYLINSSGEQR